VRLLENGKNVVDNYILRRGKKSFIYKKTFPPEWAQNETVSAVVLKTRGKSKVKTWKFSFGWTGGKKKLFLEILQRYDIVFWSFNDRSTEHVYVRVRIMRCAFVTILIIIIIIIAVEQLTEYQSENALRTRIYYYDRGSASADFV